MTEQPPELGDDQQRHADMLDSATEAQRDDAPGEIARADAQDDTPRVDDESSEEGSSEDEESDSDSEEEEDDEDEEDDEPRMKHIRLTAHLGAVYRNGDATSAFIVAGDKMVRRYTLSVRRMLTSL